MESSYQNTINEYRSLAEQLSSPEVLSDSNQLREISIKQSALQNAYDIAVKMELHAKEIAEAEKLLETEQDEDMRGFYQESLEESLQKFADLEHEYNKATIETDPDDQRNTIMEIRAGTGGEEAALFAGDLYRMYKRYIETQGWTLEPLNTAGSDTGGFKEVSFKINGKGSYGKLRFESGVHRVQRVPTTESSGRIHTSAASVVVLPEVDDVDIEISEDDLKIETYRSSGPGGQSVNTTDSAVRITHVPSGIVVAIQDEKSQHKNKAKAMTVLKSRLYDLEQQRQEERERSKRQSAIKGGDRSAKIRTYNFPQSRVTDHRIKETWHNLNEILDGNIAEVIETVREKLLSAN